MKRWLVLLLLLAAPFARAELTGPQITELRTRLDALADAIATGHAKDTRASAQALRQWSRQVDLSLPVDLLCDRATQLAATDFAGFAPPAEQLRAALRHLSANLAQLESRASASLTDAQRTLALVLADREYQTGRPQTSWWEILALKLMRGLERLFELLSRIPGGEKIGEIGFYFVVALLLVPLVALIGYLLWRQFQSRRQRLPAVATQPVTTLELPAVYLARAEELLARGARPEALKQFYLAVLATLEQRGWAAPDRTRTNWEYLAQLETHRLPAQSTTLLRALNRIYDRVVYGAQPCDEPLAREFAGLSRQLVAAPERSGTP